MHVKSKQQLFRQRTAFANCTCHGDGLGALCCAVHIVWIWASLQVLREINTYAKGISGVPHFMINRQYALSGIFAKVFEELC